MVETVAVIAIIGAAAVYTGRVFYRMIAGRRKSCGCEDGCAVSTKCADGENDCAVTAGVLDDIARRSAKNANKMETQ